MESMSFLFQGIHHPEYFGLIIRENESTGFICYVFMCASDAVVSGDMFILISFKRIYNTLYRSVYNSFKVEFVLVCCCGSLLYQ